MLGLSLGLYAKSFINKKTIVYDSFNRADNPASLGVADTGQTWEILNGTWGITGNQAYSSTAGAATALINTPSDNYVLSCKFSVYDTYNALFFRFVVNGSFWRVEVAGGHYVLTRVVSWTTTQMANTGIIPASGDTVSVSVSGDRIEVLINGASAAVVNDNANITGAKCGMYIYGRPNVRFDDFKVVQ